MYRVENEQAYKPCANWDEEMPSGLTASMAHMAVA